MDRGAPVRAVLDANVLYSAFIRDVLLRLAAADLYLPCWSERIHEEWMRNLLAHRPDLPESSLLRTRAAMDAFFPDALVAAYEPMEARFSGVDVRDRHVAAAALKAQAGHIVTQNLRDFPSAALSAHGISACSPDQLIRMLAAEHPNARARCARGTSPWVEAATAFPRGVPGHIR